MGPGTQSPVCSPVGLSESSGWFTHENPQANCLGVFLSFFTGLVQSPRFPGVDIAGWLAREAEQDRADGFGPTVTDPTALRLLALGMTAARAQKQAPVCPVDVR